MLTRDTSIKNSIVFKNTETITKEESIVFLEIIADIKNLKAQLAEKKTLLISMLSGLSTAEKTALKTLIDEAKL